MAAKRGRYDAFEVGLTIVPQYFKARWVENLVPFVNDPALTDQAFYQFEGLSPPLAEVKLEGVHKKYGKVEAVRNLRRNWVAPCFCDGICFDNPRSNFYFHNAKGIWLEV